MRNKQTTKIYAIPAFNLGAKVYGCELVRAL
jgi:hypothetical protein